MGCKWDFDGDEHQKSSRWRCFSSDDSNRRKTFPTRISRRRYMWRKKSRTIRQPITARKPGFLGLLLAAALIAAGALLPWTLPISTESGDDGAVTVWQLPTHRCCTEWVSYLRRKG